MHAITPGLRERIKLAAAGSVPSERKRGSGTKEFGSGQPSPRQSPLPPGRGLYFAIHPLMLLRSAPNLMSCDEA